MKFLDTTKKVWKLKDLELPVRENVPMKELKWFRDQYKEILQKNESGELTQIDALKFDDIWWDKLAQIGLGTTVDKLMDSGCTEREFRDFMAELYIFLTNLSTIEEAKQLDSFVPKIQNNEKKP